MPTDITPPPPKRGPGAPAKIPTDDQIAIAAKWIRDGHFMQVACGKINIDDNTWYRWMEIGSADAAAGVESPYKRFREAVKNADTEALAEHTANIKALIGNNWMGLFRYGESKWQSIFTKYPREQHITHDVRITTIEPSLPRVLVEDAPPVKQLTQGKKSTRKQPVNE